jgi:kinetochore protein NDC80
MGRDGMGDGHRYPFFHDISKSHLQAVGSLHAWPVLLAMLTWLVELIVVRPHGLPKHMQGALNMCGAVGLRMRVVDMQACSMNMQQQQPPARERLFFNYLSNAYKMWMAGHDTFDALLADLSQTFGPCTSSCSSAHHHHHHHGAPDTPRAALC